MSFHQHKCFELFTARNLKIDRKYAFPLSCLKWPGVLFSYTCNGITKLKHCFACLYTQGIIFCHKIYWNLRGNITETGKKINTHADQGLN